MNGVHAAFTGRIGRDAEVRTAPLRGSVTRAGAFSGAPVKYRQCLGFLKITRVYVECTERMR
jgi:hypothetical protein